ncbi:MAG: class I SAM-dependent methyltransferase [Betaproteobacteria bacterium]
MNKPDIKTILKETFDAVSPGYDDRALRFFPASAGHMAALLGLRGDERVLDVACGTGHVSLAVARLLPRGHVTAVDFSQGMLGQARKKAAASNVANIEFLERDMQNLKFENRFDVAVCAFGIFFVMDMEAQLAHIVSAVKPGGRIAITNFLEDYFSPFKERFFDRMSSYGVQNPPQAWKRIAHEAGCRRLFESAGLLNIRIETRNVGYYLDNADDWWSIVWNAGLRRYVTQLSHEDQERFKQEHLREIEALRSEEGIWLDVGVLYTIGTKAQGN